MNDKRVLAILFGILGIVVGSGIFVYHSNTVPEKPAAVVDNYRAATYLIEGEEVTLGGQTQYFGNDLVTDLNNDGRDDVVFLVTQAPGGSGTFYYAVAALNTEHGYLGSDGYFLGDRIAPQTIEKSQNPKYVDVIVVNYADRADDEAFSTSPSVGQSVYLKLDPKAMQWGIVVPDFEGESNL